LQSQRPCRQKSVLNPLCTGRENATQQMLRWGWRTALQTIPAEGPLAVWVGDRKGFRSWTTSSRTVERGSLARLAGKLVFAAEAVLRTGVWTAELFSAAHNGGCQADHSWKPSARLGRHCPVWGPGAGSERVRVTTLVPVLHAHPDWVGDASGTGGGWCLPDGPG